MWSAKACSLREAVLFSPQRPLPMEAWGWFVGRGRAHAHPMCVLVHCGEVEGTVAVHMAIVCPLAAQNIKLMVCSGGTPPPSCSSTALSKHMSPSDRRVSGFF